LSNGTPGIEGAAPSSSMVMVVQTVVDSDAQWKRQVNCGRADEMWREVDDANRDEEDKACLL